MKLFCCYTPAHGVLYERIFKPSIPKGYEVRPTEIDETGAGDYLSPEFLRCIRAKVDLVSRSLDEFPDEPLVWSDVDVRFVDLPVDRLLSDFTASGSDIVFQRESPRMKDVNTGFFICRSTPSVRKFFESVHRELTMDVSLNEQMAANKILSAPQTPESLRWEFLPSVYYARTHGWPPPRKLAIYHANFTKGHDAIGLKLAQFAELDRVLKGGWAAWIASIVRRVPGKILRRG
jgi:hypothetical protein